MGERVQLDKANQIVMLFNTRDEKWEDQTTSISAMFTAYYYGHFTGYDIYFKGTNKKFFYQFENVRVLNKIKTINTAKKAVFINGSLVNATSVDQFESGYYRIHLQGRTVVTQSIKLMDNQYRDILTYYDNLAAYAGYIAEEETPLYFLSQNYKRITPSLDSVLFDYIEGQFHATRDEKLLIVPFEYNQSQAQAIQTALTNSISVIEGPPGTGKTQTILNLIANIIYRSKNCAVVSNNNTAIDNIYEKLDDQGLAFLSASLGRRKNVEEFFESDQNAELIDFLDQEEKSIYISNKTKFRELSFKMKKIQETEVETAIFESQLIDIKNEKKHYDQISKDIIVINQKLHSKDYIKLIARLESTKKIHFFERWRLERKYRIKIAKTDINMLLNNAETLYYQTKINELKEAIFKRREYLKKNDKDMVSKHLKALSLTLLEKHIQNHYRKNGFKEFTKESYKREFNNFLVRYPVVLSTTQSLLNNAPKGFTFDYLIIDEASQGDLLSSVIAISCAKNLVVVGDSRQLQQIDEERLFSKATILEKKHHIPQPYTYEANSILKSVKNAVENVPTTLLREHYRCAPDIINFCNKMFYDGELIAMTKNEGSHIEIIKTVPGNHARSNPNGSGLYNQREIDEIENILQTSESKSIGIITPFRYQANLITETYATDRIEADTVHKFQGRQKEEIILSFVVNSLDKKTSNIENRIYDFVTNEKLLNVAISRSINKITAIVSDKVYHSANNAVKDFINYAEYLYNSNITKESTITSVFDQLYAEYTNVLLAKYKEKPKEYKTELLMADMIDVILKNYGYIGYSMHTRLGKLVTVTDEFTEEEKRYILHPWTHVDFLFYNKVSKERLFVIEVDGIKYHEQDQKQTEHDDIKDRILRSNNIPIYRFKTNQSNEKQRLNEIVMRYTD